MDLQNYKCLINNTIKYNTPEYQLRQMIKKLKEANIATYNEDDRDDNKVVINSKDSREDRVNLCITQKDESLYYYELIEFVRGYRYSIYFSYDDVLFEDIDKYYFNIEDILALTNLNGLTYNKPIYYKIKNKVMVKFSKTISIYNEDVGNNVDIRYSTLWIFHEDLNILEVRFDRLEFKNDDRFYERTYKAELAQLTGNLKFKYEYYYTSEAVKYIIEKKSDEVIEISQLLGLKQNSSAKLKVGKNLVMPFLGDIENLIEEKYEYFDKNNETRECLKIIENYIKGIRKNAIYKQRLISWINKEYDLNINIISNYREKNYELYNFYNPKNLNLEMMNYAIEYIAKEKQNIRDSKQG